ncbi:MAG: ATP-binding protein [Polyangiales bacterium]
MAEGKRFRRAAPAVHDVEPSRLAVVTDACGPRVLVVHEHPGVRAYLMRLLEGVYSVEAVSSGAAALASAQRRPPSLVVTTEAMAIEPGTSFVQAMRRDPATWSAPVVLLGGDQSGHARDGRPVGGDEALIAPMRPAELLTRVGAQLELARLRVEAAEGHLALRASIDEADALARLHDLTTRLLATTELQPLLEEVLTATMALLTADGGTLQLFDREARALRIVVHRGLPPEFLASFVCIDDTAAACGRAAARRERVIVPDVTTDPDFEPHRAMALRANVRAVQSTPLCSREGELLGMLSTHFRAPHRPSDRKLRMVDLYARLAADLIERKRAEEALRSSEERFRGYFELGVVGMAIISPDKRFLEVNDELCRILDCDRAALLPRTWAELTHPEDLAADLVRFESVLVGASDSYTLDKRWLRLDRKVVHTTVSTKCVRNADDSVAYFIALILDNTERRRADDVMRRLREQLAHVARVNAMGELVASMAHQMNQPLAAVVANAQACLRWLSHVPPNFGEARAAVRRIVNDAYLASDLIARTHTFLRRERTRQGVLDLPAMVREVLEMVQHDLRAQELDAKLSVSSLLPRAHGDRVQVQQVILNLVKNAIEAMTGVDTGARDIEISVDAFAEDVPCVSVRDSGGGIAPDVREQIFEAFYTTKPTGLGMGLTISRSIVEAHGGRIWATPNRPRGETFRFTLRPSPP